MAERSNKVPGCPWPYTEYVSQTDAIGNAGTTIPVVCSSSFPKKSPAEVVETGDRLSGKLVHRPCQIWRPKPYHKIRGSCEVHEVCNISKENFNKSLKSWLTWLRELQDHISFCRRIWTITEAVIVCTKYQCKLWLLSVPTDRRYSIPEWTDEKTEERIVISRVQNKAKGYKKR